MTLFLELIARFAPFLAASLAGALLGAAGAWWVQSLKIDKLAAEHTAYVIEAEAFANLAEAKRVAMEIKWKQEVDDAKAEAKEREKQLVSDLDAATRAAERLRGDASALRTRLADAPAAACLNAAVAAGELLAECGEAYRDLAGAADRHVSDVRTLTQAWPR
jgi:septal ring factor EnvC (AmiA/AmiB activator)